MALQITQAQALVYLTGLLEVLRCLDLTLETAAVLQDDNDAFRLPEGMLQAFVPIRESLDDRFHEVYAAIYGNDTQDCVATDHASPTEGVG